MSVTIFITTISFPSSKFSSMWSPFFYTQYGMDRLPPELETRGRISGEKGKDVNLHCNKNQNRKRGLAHILTRTLRRTHTRIPRIVCAGGRAQLCAQPWAQPPGLGPCLHTTTNVEGAKADRERAGRGRLTRAVCSASKGHPAPRADSPILRSFDRHRSGPG